MNTKNRINNEMFFFSRKVFIRFFILFFACFSVSVFLFYTTEADNKVTVTGKCYDSSTQFQIATSASKNQMVFGKSGAGSLTLSRASGATNISKSSKSKNNYQTYKGKGPITIGYNIIFDLKSGDKNVWHVVSDGGKEVAGISLSNKIQDGVLVIRKKGLTGSSWTKVAEYSNFFSNKKLDKNNLFLITEDDLKQGTYFEVTVAYKIEKKTNEKSGFLGIKTDVMSQRYCIESYQFFIYYDGNPVVFRDMVTSKNLNSGDSSDSGFIIDKKGSSYAVTIKKDSENGKGIQTLSLFTEPGVYIISVADPVGQTYSSSITVTKGTKLTDSIAPDIFRNEKKNGYSVENTANSTIGPGAHTSLVIGQIPYKAIKKSQNKYGVTGESVLLFLKVDPSASRGWITVDDDFGKKDSQKIKDTYTGPVRTGALIIRTSKDGKTYNTINSSKYAKGLFTTDFENHYGTMGYIPIYMPSGEDIINGIYIQILYAYEAKNESQKKDYRILEQYYVYICSDNLDAITFHNLSAKNNLQQALEGYDEATADIHMRAETMLSNAYTVSGFEIDRKLNRTVSYSLTKDGKKINNQSNNRYQDTGKYVITLKNPVGTSREVILYVDRMSDEEAFDYYFGESFIRGKRIYSEGQYPVYEGGHTSYFLNPIDEYHVPLGGYIKNLTTDETIEITPNREGIQGDIVNPGDYIAVFNTNPKFDIDPDSGDCREFTFHFRIIAEGTAPGPVINKRNLLTNYAHTTISDSYPIYYGLVYQSATKGNITLAFATMEAAIEFAKGYERGTVEQQPDGSYRYTGSLLVKQKEKYESNWDLMDAIEYFAEEAVQPYYFDLSEDFTSLSLSQKTIEGTNNLRTLELDRSVVIFADGQKPLLTNITAIPIISPKPYKYLEPGLDGNIELGYDDFQFVRDKYGCDSDSIVIIDKNGNEYSINYNEDVGKQLAGMKCPTGIVTIREKTIYGDIAEYEAVYIEPGINTAILTLNTHSNTNNSQLENSVSDISTDIPVFGEVSLQSYSQADDGKQISLYAFSIRNVQDELDPYNLVIVSNKENSQNDLFFVADQKCDKTWIEPGEYSIKVVNRLGYSYTINIIIEESNYASIHFTGMGTEDIEIIQTSFGSKDVKIPELTRYGYEFVGFEDKNGRLYNSEIDEILFRGSTVLKAVWKAKQFNLSIQDSEGHILQTNIVSFGEEYILPQFITQNGVQYAGWTINGNPVSGNVIKLGQEGDIVLVASVIENASEIEATQPADDGIVPMDNTTDSSLSNHEKQNSQIIWFGVGGGLIILIIILLLNVRKKNDGSTVTSETQSNTIVQESSDTEEKEGDEHSSKQDQSETDIKVEDEISNEGDHDGEAE